MIAHRAQAAAARRAAASNGTLTFTGTRCRAAGHDGTRYTSTGACVACMAERYDAARLAAGKTGPTRRRLPNVADPAAAVVASLIV